MLHWGEIEKCGQSACPPHMRWTAAMGIFRRGDTTNCKKSKVKKHDQIDIVTTNSNKSCGTQPVFFRRRKVTACSICFSLKSVHSNLS